MNDQNTSVLPAYIGAALRTGGAIVGGWLINKGYITADQAPIIGGGVLAIIAAAWSFNAKSRANAALKAAIAASAGQAK